VHYFPLHIGDYTRKASHLTLLEDGVYNRLLRIYYDKEQPLPADLAAVQRLAGARGKDEKQAVERVLYEFFRLCDDGWRNEKADEVIASFYKKSDKARESAAARWTAKARVALSEASERNANAMRTHSEGNATHNPIPITQSQKIKSTVRQAARFPEFWSVYPNKKGKQEAEKRWLRDGLDERADAIIAHVRLMTLEDDGWQRGYAPMGSTYLNQARWTDEPRGPPQASNPVRPIGRDMQAVMKLEEMKNGLVRTGNHNGYSEIAVLEAPGFALLGDGSWDGGGLD
jgi:uncharacterized protein YdaU (DUF1376 family)